MIATLMNSTYGATLNEFCRFHDPRLGASTTGTGRQITTHMIHTVAKCLIGDNAPKLIKTIQVNKKGEIQNTYTMDVPVGIGPIYSDTDSCYFVMENLVNESIEDGVACADAVTATVNESFAAFVRESFFCQPEFENAIEANREIVATSGIFRAKKKYILLVADMEGKRLSPDNDKALKTQGSDIKISSTPETIRGLLKDVTMKTLRGINKKEIDDLIINFRRNLNSNPNIKPLDFASISSVNDVEIHTETWERIEKAGYGKVKLTFQVRAAINHNECLKEFGDNDTLPILSGTKIKIVWLKNNEHGYTNMAFDSDTEDLPTWFYQHFEIDVKLTEQKLIDQKIGNIFEPIGWQVPTEQTLIINKLLAFD